MLALKRINFFQQRIKRGERSYLIQGLVFFRPKNVREELWSHPPQLYIRICNGKEAPLSVADGTWMCGCRFGAHNEETGAKEESASATCSDGVDVKLGALDRDTCTAKAIVDRHLDHILVLCSNWGQDESFRAAQYPQYSFRRRARRCHCTGEHLSSYPPHRWQRQVASLQG
jgi:hypothetical protein